ncbi:MAG: serine hydrolase [Bacteroidota bacterium]
MIRSIFLLFFLPFCMFPLFSQIEEQTSQEIDAYIATAMDIWQVPGLAIAIVNRDSILYAKGYGILDLRDTLPVDANSLFAVASNTKAFTATAIGLLVQEGKIDWDDKLLDYLPHFQLHDPVATRKLTVRDLLCHRVGHATWGGDLTWYGSTYDRDEVVRRIRYQEAHDEFRTSYGYSNLMFLLAGEVIEVVTGQSWDAFIEERFFDPLEMSRSNTSVRRLESLDNVATPHSYRLGDIFPVSYRNVDNVGPAAAINSSVTDMGHWLQLQLNRGTYNKQNIVRPSIIAETHTSHTLRPLSQTFRSLYPHTHFRTYGLGWGKMDYHGNLLISHTGGMDGMYSYTGFIPEKNLGVVVLSNRDNHSLHTAIPLYVFDQLLKHPRRDWSRIFFDQFRSKEQTARKEASELEKDKEWAQPTLSAPAYLGQYESNIYGKAEIVSKEDQLTIRLLAHPSIVGHLEHWQRDIWLAKWSDPIWNRSFVTFDLDDQQQIRQFRLQIRPDWIDPLEYVFTKEAP